MERPCALVTGATSGIGLEFARSLATRGHDLVAVARSAGALEDVATELSRDHLVEVETIPADLGDGDGLRRVEARAGSADRPLATVVNNAGYGIVGEFVSMPESDVQGMIDLNVTALVRITRAALARMVPRGTGSIVNVASIGSYQPVRDMAVYGATKAFVHSFTLAVASEVAASGVRVLSLCPGYTETGFQARAGVGDRLPALVVGSARDVVDTCLSDLDRGRRTSIPGALNKVGAVAGKVAPGRVSAPVAGALLRTRGH